MASLPRKTASSEKGYSSLGIFQGLWFGADTVRGQYLTIFNVFLLSPSLAGFAAWERVVVIHTWFVYYPITLHRQHLSYAPHTPQATVSLNDTYSRTITL